MEPNFLGFFSVGLWSLFNSYKNIQYIVISRLNINNCNQAWLSATHNYGILIDRIMLNSHCVQCLCSAGPFKMILQNKQSDICNCIPIHIFLPYTTTLYSQEAVSGTYVQGLTCVVILTERHKLSYSSYGLAALIWFCYTAQSLGSCSKSYSRSCLAFAPRAFYTHHPQALQLSLLQLLSFSYVFSLTALSFR